MGKWPLPSFLLSTAWCYCCKWWSLLEWELEINQSAPLTSNLSITSHQCVCCPRVSQSPLIYDVCFQKDASLRLQSGTSLTPSFIYRLWWKTLGMEGEVFVVHLLRCCSFNATDSYQQHPLWAYQAIQHKCRFSEHCGGFPQVSFTSWCFPSRWNNNNINNNKNVIREKHWSFVFDHSLLFPSHLKLCVFHPLAVHLLVGFTHQKWSDCKVTTFISACHWWHKILWRRLEWLLIFSYYVSKEQDSPPPPSDVEQ